MSAFSKIAITVGAVSCIFPAQVDSSTIYARSSQAFLAKSADASPPVTVVKPSAPVETESASLPSNVSEEKPAAEEPAALDLQQAPESITVKAEKLIREEPVKAPEVEKTRINVDISTASRPFQLINPFSANLFDFRNLPLITSNVNGVQQSYFADNLVKFAMGIPAGPLLINTTAHFIPPTHMALALANLSGTAVPGAFQVISGITETFGALKTGVDFRTQTGQQKNLDASFGWDLPEMPNLSLKGALTRNMSTGDMRAQMVQQVTKEMIVSSIPAKFVAAVNEVVPPSGKVFATVNLNLETPLGKGGTIDFTASAPTRERIGTYVGASLTFHF